ncbi:hypothetical protein [Bradyrhizobium sp. LHD-71]|uniref:hypothetical protein n=1 Tax=Bradyrhizobium sp. LHD-71 TaxID=3072141 RepID=UPI00280F2C8E|nr:hypothetical protein [Bradyrhizobium sp. LHD-71]MDQ8727319.1 hypothetical protein [Bradyrhizobium sp. LHD-71]
MHWVDLVGYLASGLVVLTFYMDDMVSLRVTALFSNVAFLAYGLGLELGPVIFLHGILLPLNIWRLWQVRRSWGAPPVAVPGLPVRSPRGSVQIQRSAKRQLGV